jgi:transcriptional regulator with XRE-family HTH domain
MFDLKSFRKYNNLTQNDIAAILDVSRISVLKAEKGELAIPPRWVEVLIDKYGIIVNDFITNGKREPIIKYRDNGNHADPNKSSQIPLYSLNVEAGFDTGL